MAKYLFSAVLVFSIIFGLLLPQITTLWQGYLNPILALLMFFSVLRVEERELRKVNMPELLSMLAFVFIMMPLLSLPFRLSDPLTFVGVLIALASPSAAATAYFSSFLGGDIALGVSASFLTSLLSLFTLPLTTQLFASQAVQIDQSKVIAILVEVILIPIIIALLFKKFLKGASEVINRNRDYQLVVVFLLGSAMVGIGHDAIMKNEYGFFGLTAAVLLLILLGGTLAYLFGKRYGNKVAVTFFVATGVKNAMLSFAIVFSLFGVSAVLPLVANLIAQYLLMVIFEVYASSPWRS